MTYSDINKEKDKFNELLRQKLEQHEVPLKEDLWQNIESKIQPRKKHFVLIPWISAAAVALILLTVFLLNPLELHQPAVNKEQIAEIDIQKDEKNIVENNLSGKENDASESKNEARIISEKTITSSVNEPKSKHNTRSNVEKSLATEPENLTAENQAEAKEEDEKQSNTNSATIAENKSKEQHEENTVYDEFFLKENSQLWKEEQAELNKIIKQNKKKSWQLAAVYGSNSGMTGTEKNMFNADLTYSKWTETSSNGQPEMLTNPNNTIYSRAELAPEDFSEKSHMPPLSFGFMLRKDITDHFSLESGLNYTYLHTKLSHNSINKYDGKMELHYLGIPVNLIVKFLNKPKWDIYASAGGMIEKGLQSKFSQNIYLNNEVHPGIRKEPVKGMQMSLNAALGVSYDIYNDFGIYIEPRISYFFDNDQPFSIRTENKLTFGLNLGLKYSL